MFQVIWTHADFDGAFQWDPEALAMKGLPRDDFDAGEALARLEHDGFIRSYTVGGKRFGFVVNWHKHQDPHPGEKPIFPRPSDDPDFQVKVKEVRWRKPGDTAFESPEIERGLYPWLQLAGRLLATCTEVAGRLSATDKEGKEGKEGPSQEEDVPRLEPLTRQGPKPKAERQPKPIPKLEAILGPKGSPDDLAYWKLVGIFGAAKNPAPTQTAQAFVNAMMTIPPHSILAKAQNLRDSLSGPQFMPQLQKWLDGQGYLNPDAPSAGMAPSHRRESDEEYAALLEREQIGA
ncbi:hypothetical protein [Geothrix limicola]|nr:hypothetical protein [Geothrix limicola]